MQYVITDNVNETFSHCVSTGTDLWYAIMTNGGANYCCCNINQNVHQLIDDCIFFATVKGIPFIVH